MDLDFIPKYKLFQFKKSETWDTFHTQKRHTLQLIDISSDLFFDDIKAQEEYMNITTSSISHEMRNPLNSIISQCKIQASNIRDLTKLIDKLRAKLTPNELSELETIRDNLKQSNDTQKTSSQMLLFNVEDILGMAQIRAKKFSKVMKKFELTKAIKDVISIQFEAAFAKGVNLSYEIVATAVEGFNYLNNKFSVVFDKKRLQ